MQWDADYVPGVKLGLHIFQVIFAFIIFILEIVVFRSDLAVIVGNNAWPFALVFLSIPAWIFLIMTPRFQRTRKLAQPHAMLAVDGVFTVLWLSAFASQAAYNTANLCGAGCGTSKAVVGMAFFELLFWGGSTFISAYTMQYYQFHGELPGYDKVGTGRAHQNIDPDKAAFSMAPHDEEAYAPINANEHDHDHDDGVHHNQPYNADSFGSRPMFDSEAEYRPHSTSPAPPHDNPFDNTYRAQSHSPAHDDPYSSGYGAQPPVGSGGPRIYAPPTAEEYEDGRPAQFPVGNYDRGLH